MRGEELVIWSAACGSIAVITLLALAEAVRLGNSAGWRNFLWLFATFHLVVVQSGLTPYLYPWVDVEVIDAASVFLGPLWFSLCAFLVRFQDPHWRTGRLTDSVVWGVVWTGPLLVLCACLVEDHRFLASIAPFVLLSSIVLMSALAAWAGLRGSAESWGLALAGLVAAPALASLSARQSLEWLAPSTQAAAAFFVVLATLTVGALVRFPGLHHYLAKSKVQPTPEKDPLTRLYSSTGIVRKLLQVQRRQRRIGGTGAVLMVYLSDTEALLRQHSQWALDALLVSIAARIQLVVGHRHPVGRYGADCFVIVLEDVCPQHDLERLSSRLRRAMAEPLQLRSLAVGAEPLTPRFGLGGVRLTPIASIDDVLFKAQELAHAGVGTKRP